MTLYLGNHFHTPLLPVLLSAPPGDRCLNPAGLLAFLETYYGLGQPSVNRAALRSEMYRQALQFHLAETEAAGRPAPFYVAAFRADAFATAEELLARRDELLDAGYFLYTEAAGATPERIAVLHELEALLLDERNELDLLPGPADRTNQLINALGEDLHPRLTVHVHEPRALLTPGTRRLLDALEAAGDRILSIPEPASPTATTDLTRWQRRLLGSTKKADQVLAADGSLILLRAQRETHLAAYLARLLKDNPDWRPDVLMTVRNQTLDNAIRMEGLPSMGIPSTSLARPSLQVLKLVTAFLWEPFDVQRIMEFVSLVTKPLERRLGQRIARALADRPGLFGPGWYAMIGEFEREIEERNWPPARRQSAMRQYRFWFERNRYPQNARVPKGEVRALFTELFNWAREEHDTNGVEGLLILAAQAQRATELLDTQPEADLGYLEVERLVRNVYQPAPVQHHLPQRGAPDAAFAAAAVAELPNDQQQPLTDLVWWDFVDQDTGYFFSRYYPPELAYLEQLGVRLASPADRNQLQIWEQLRPALRVRDRLLLCLPQRVDGTEVQPHLLMGDLEATFGDSLRRITVDIDAGEDVTLLLEKIVAPAYAPQPLRPLSPPQPLLQVDPAALTEREKETPSSLEDLLYYPYKWVFTHQLDLRATPILSIASENRLRGNLSHLFVERLLHAMQQDGDLWPRARVQGWLESNAERLLRQQGAVLLEYGQEPERVQFVETMKYSAWSLVNHIKNGGWTIRGSEEKLEGDLSDLGQRLHGRADLLLERTTALGREIAVVDLKWRGKSVFRNLLRNAEDIQLCLYAEIVSQQERGEARVHTAYYVLRDALMLARNEVAFANVETVTSADPAPAVQARTLARIRATYDWRWEQFAEGVVEVRCAETAHALEDAYARLDHDRLLEPKVEDARFDDYRALIGLVR